MKKRKQAKILSVVNAKGILFRIGDKVKDYSKKRTIEEFKVRNNYHYEERPEEQTYYVMAKIKRQKGSSLVAINIDFLTHWNAK